MVTLIIHKVTIIQNLTIAKNRIGKLTMNKIHTDILIMDKIRVDLVNLETIHGKGVVITKELNHQQRNCKFENKIQCDNCLSYGHKSCVNIIHIRNLAKKT